MEDDTKTLIETLVGKMIDIEQRISNIETVDIEPLPGSTLAEWSPEAFHEPGEIGGIVVNESLARSTPCSRIALGKGELWYSKGIVGALSEDEKLMYCDAGIEDIKATLEQQARQQTFKDAAILCQSEVEGLPQGEKLEPFLKCVSVTAKKHGINI